MDFTNIWTQSFEDAYKVLAEFYQNPEQIKKCNQMSQMLIETFNNGGNVFSCGNGGSHCDAMHFAEEFTGRYRDDRRALGALALGDPSHVTCVSNDYGFEHIFSRQLDGLGRKGDMMIGLSTSGNSANVIKAVEVAKEKGIKTVGLLGKGGGKLKDMVDLAIVVPANTSDRVQEIHIKILHTVIETAERAIFPENYA
ncbi:MAG: D-sedoheptulose 7-phosphate isomerase [Bdellovibrionales bacterium]|nr:D-sedoheptulose 7-phosphate isomerase [Bdellovibrionales bacterium]